MYGRNNLNALEQLGRRQTVQLKYLGLHVLRNVAPALKSVRNFLNFRKHVRVRLKEKLPPSLELLRRKKKL